MVDIDELRRKHASARPTFGETIGTYDENQIAYHGPSVIWYDAIHAALPALLDELTAARAELVRYRGVTVTYGSRVKGVDDA